MPNSDKKQDSKAAFNGWYWAVGLLRIGEYLDGSLDGANLEMLLGNA